MDQCIRFYDKFPDALINLKNAFKQNYILPGRRFILKRGFGLTDRQLGGRHLVNSHDVT